MELYRGPHRVVAVLCAKFTYSPSQIQLESSSTAIFCVGLPLHTWKFLYYLFNEVQIELFVILFIISLSIVK